MDDTPDDVMSHWLFELVEMKAKHTFQVAGLPRKVRLYFIRRTDSGHWQVKHIDDSWRAEYRSLQEGAAAGHAASFMAEKRLDALGDGPSWVEILDEEMAGPLESQYQRFIRQYRES